MSIELTVILKDSERTYRQKFLVYEDVSFNSNDFTIKECINLARKNFDGEPDDIQVKGLLVIQ